MRQQQSSSSESNSGSTRPRLDWSVACHICNVMSPKGYDGLLTHYVDEHPRSRAARERTLFGTTTR